MFDAFNEYNAQLVDIAKQSLKDPVYRLEADSKMLQSGAKTVMSFAEPYI